MKKNDIAFIIGVVILIVLAHIAIKNAYINIRANETVLVSDTTTMDLSDWDEKISSFKGVVHYFDDVTMSDYNATLEPSITKKLPISWWDNSEYAGYSPHGYGLYHWTFTGLDPTHNYGLKFDDIETAYKVYINEAEMLTVGHFSTDSSQHRGNVKSAFVSFTPDEEGRAEVFIEVSNYALHVGGIWNTIELGLYDDILQMAIVIFLLETMLTAGTLTLLLLSVAFLIKDPRRKALPLVAILSLVASVNSIFSGSRLGFYLFPNIPFEMELRLEYLSAYLLVPLFVILCNIFINPKHGKVINRILASISLLLTGICLLLPQDVYVNFKKPYLVIASLLTIGLLTLIVTAYRKNYQGKKVIILSIALSIIAIDKEMTFSTDFSLVGLVTFIIIFLFGWLTIRQYMDDIKENKRLKEKVNVDELTGLNNREYFLNQLEVLQSDYIETIVSDRKSYILFMDLDGLKKVNDEVSHLAGDHVIIESSKRIKASLRSDDLIARYGGDEFLVLLNHVTYENVEEVASRIIRYINEPMFTSEGTFNLGISIGIYEVDIQEDVRTWVAKSDQTMYYSKQHGRNRYTFYEEMNTTT